MTHYEIVHDIALPPHGKVRWTIFAELEVGDGFRAPIADYKRMGVRAQYWALKLDRQFTLRSDYERGEVVVKRVR